MLGWIQTNLPTIAVSAALLALIVGAAAVLIRDRRKGKSTCGGNCGGCPMGGACHKKP